MEQNQLNSFNKVYSFSLKTFLIIAAGIFFLGFSLGVMGSLSSEKETPIDKKAVQNIPTPTLTSQPSLTRPQPTKEPQDVSSLKQQIKDCQEVIRLNIQVLDLSSEIIGISGNTILSLANGDIDILEIEKDTKRVDAVSAKILQLKDKIVPLTQKCFKE